MSSRESTRQIAFLLCLILGSVIVFSNGPLRLMLGDLSANDSTFQAVETHPEWENVLDHGAIPDDGIPDSLAFSAAISAMLGNGRGKLYIPRGTYLIDTQVTLNSQTEVMGDGIGVSVVRLADNANTNIFVATAKQRLTIRELSLDGNRNNLNSSGNGVLLQTVTGFVVQNVEMFDFPGSGIIAQVSCYDGVVSGCTVRNSAGHAISLSEGERISIVGNTIVDAADAGMNVSGCKWTSVTGNTFTIDSITHSSNYGGVRLPNASQHCTVSGNTISGYSRGIFILSGSMKISAINNTVQDARLEGILVHRAHYNVIAGNIVENCGDAVNEKTGIRLGGDGTTTYNIVSKNVCIDTRIPAKMKHGIFSSTDCSNNSYTGNIVKGNTSAPYQLSDIGRIYANNLP